MRNTIVRCGQCSAALRIPEATGAGSMSCHSCGVESRLWLFPALFRQRDVQRAQPLREEGHSSCMNHPHKRAVAVCDACGKYLCALCDVDWNGEHLCPSCIGHQRSADPEGALRTQYIHYDLIAVFLALVAIPTSLFVFGIFITPVVMFLGWRYWRAPWRPVPYRKWIMVLAVLLAATSLVGWVSFFVFLLATA